jgi:hypothetical protein
MPVPGKGPASGNSSTSAVLGIGGGARAFELGTKIGIYKLGILITNATEGSTHKWTLKNSLKWAVNFNQPACS